MKPLASLSIKLHRLQINGEQIGDILLYLGHKSPTLAEDNYKKSVF